MQRHPWAAARSSGGLRDLLIAMLAVATLFTLGALFDVYDQAERALARSGSLDEVIALGSLALMASFAITIRRWRSAAQEERLRQRAEAGFQALVEGSPAVTYAWDAREHRFLYVSPQVERVLGYTREEWTEGGMWLEATHPHDREGLLSSVIAADDGEAPSFSREYRVTTKTGELRWVHDESSDIEWNDAGLPLVSLGVMTDITELREADARAEEAEARFRTIVERVPAVAYVWDGANEPGSAAAAYISPQIETLLGYRAEDWLHHPDAWAGHVHPDDLTPVLDAWRSAVTTGASFEAEYRIRANDDRWVTVRDEANPVGTGAGGTPLYQGVMFDVSARRAAEDALREAEVRSRSLLENLPVTVYMADYEDAEPWTVYDRWIGPGIEELLGITPEAWNAEEDPWLDHIHPDDRDEMLAAWRATLVEGGRFEQEYRMVHRDGSVVWVHEEARAVVRGTRVRADGFFANITERTIAEAERREAEDRFKRLVEQLPAITYLEEASTGRLLYISPRIDLIYGDTAEEWMATPGLWEQRLHPEDRDRMIAHNQADTGDTWTAEYRSLTREGRVIWVRNEAHLVRDDAGEPRYWQGLVFDITDRKEAEEQIRTAEERYRSLVEDLPVVVYTDAVDELSTAVYISPIYEKITGYSAEERLADPGLWARILHEDDRDRVLQESERTNLTGEPFDVEYRIRAKDGRVVWVHDQARQVTGPQGVAVWQGVLEDVTERREAEQALAEATRRFQTLVEQIPATTYVEDAVTEREIYVSPQVQTTLGYTPEEWIRDDGWERAVHPDDREAVLEEDRRAGRDGDVFHAEYRLLAKDGRAVWIREEALPVQDEAGTIVHWQGVRFDITAEKEAEDQLRAAEERYRLVVEELPAIAYVDERSDDSEGRTWPCIYVSPQVETILGYTQEEWTGGPETWDEMIHPDDMEIAEEADRRHYELGEPVDVEYRVRGRDGGWIWLRDQAVIVNDESGEPRWSQGIWLDVTERKLAEIALHEAEARYRGIVEHVPAAIYLDRADASMETVYVSPQIEELTGYPPQEWIDRPGLWIEILDPEDREEIVEPYTQAIIARRPWSAEYRSRRRDGRTIWLHDEVTYIPGADGEPDLVQGVLYDVTERKLAEQALRESERREREAAERLRSLDEMKNTFLAAVSHELRSPLTSILGLALTLERAPEIASEDRGDLLVRLAANARKLDRLLKDLLDIDRLNRGIVEPQYRVTDVGALARRTLEHLDQLGGRTLVVETEAVILAVDPPKVERIVENLVLNAARHTENDRTIWLKVRPEGSGVSIVVEDDGPGVPEELRDVIFEPFRQGPTASPHSPGTGIGLSLVARFTELHEGTVTIEDREGGGASFHVFLPGHAASDVAVQETLSATGTGR